MDGKFSGSVNWVAIPIFIALATALSTFTGCGSGGPHGNPVGAPESEAVVVHSIASLNVTFDNSAPSEVAGDVASLKEDLNGQVPITITNAPSATLTLNTALWLVPPIKNAVLNFGYLSLSALTDNNLDVCGLDGKAHCGKAMLRMYTTGAGGAGLWNTIGAYGVPIQVVVPGPATLVVGLEQVSAVVLQQITLPATKHVIQLADFSPAPKYNVKVDFTNGGTGSYSTNLILEYALGL